MNRIRTKIPKSWVLLAVFIVSVIGAGAWVFTTPPDYTTNQTGDWFGNTSNNGNNYTADRIGVMNYFGYVVGTYLDSYTCQATYCIYQPWYDSGNFYAKNTTTGKIDYIETDISKIANETLSKKNSSVTILNVVATINYPISVTQNYTQLRSVGSHLSIRSTIGAPAINVTSDYSDISGFSIDGSAAGSTLSNIGLIYVQSYSDGNRIHDNNLSLATQATQGDVIRIDSVSLNNKIYNNKLYGGRNGVFSYTQSIITGNDLSQQNHLCIYARLGIQNIISNNICTNSGGGISSDGSPGYGNVFANNVVDTTLGGSGITVDISNYNTIIGNSIHNTQFDCIRIAGSSNNTVIGNSNYNCGKSGSSDTAAIHILEDGTTYSHNNTIALNSDVSDNLAQYQDYSIMVDALANSGNYVYLNTANGFNKAEWKNVIASNSIYMHFNGTCINSSNNGGACI